MRSTFGRRPRPRPGRAGDARRDPGRMGRGRRAVRGLARRSHRADPLRRDEPVRCRSRAHRRPPRALSPGHPSPVRGRPGHALAVEPGGGRGRRRRLQPADARPRGPTRPRPPGRPRRWILSDVLDTPHELDGTGDLVYTGRGSLIWLQDLDAWAAVIARLLSPTGRFVLFEGHPARVALRCRRGRPLGGHRLRLLRRSRGLEGLGARVHRPPVPRRTASRAGSSPVPGPSGEIITALLGAGLRLERVTEHPIDWWGGHADVRPDERGRVPAVVLGRRPGRPGRRRRSGAQALEPAVCAATDDGGRDQRRGHRSDRRCAGTAARHRRIATGRRARPDPGSTPRSRAGRRRSGGRRGARASASPSVQWMKPSSASDAAS